MGLAITFGVLALCFSVYAQSASSDSQASPHELLLRAVEGELKAQADDHSHWMYEKKSDQAGKVEVKLVVETRDGDLDHLRSVNGHPITPEQEQQEEHRIQKLVHNREKHEKDKRDHHEDARRIERFMKVLPDIVTATYFERHGDLVELSFKPNPNFHPSSRETKVFHEMEGRVWIDTKQNRISEMEGHLIKEVKFGGGVLGYLHKGGRFHVKQSEVAPGHWEMTLLHVNMNGKALFFKTISVHEDQTRTDYQRVPDNLTLAQAAAELQRQYAASSQSASSSSSTPAAPSDSKSPRH
jgi:hypothetical protein